jgi:hypothetical protein
MATYLERATDLYNKINSGQLMDAFEQYYHNDVVMQEPGEEARHGKDKNRQYEVDFLSSVKEWHGGGVTAIASNETDGTTTVESWADVTFQNDQRVKLQQVAVQKWQGDQIVNERFYYNKPS